MSLAKYDRQLRLWANSGQANLEGAHVCVINATPLGSEALKNLVLPGIGEFTIVDDGLVTHEDVANGFFLEHDDVGTAVAPAMAAKLCELNPDVKGRGDERGLARTLAEGDPFWLQFNAVVLTERHRTAEPLVEQLCNVLWRLKIPLLICDTIGFYGYLHLVCPEVNVIETHPELLIDLRLDAPWPELSAHVKLIDLTALDDVAHAHVPYVVILIKALARWQAQTGSAPQTYQQKQQFKMLVREMSRDFDHEQNFAEAHGNAWRASQPTAIPPHVHELMQDARVEQNDLEVFWIFVGALREFVRQQAGREPPVLPLSGVLPDMAADSASYIALQNIYRAKARRDQDAILHQVQRILRQRGVALTIPEESVASFCKNCKYLSLTRGSRLAANDEMRRLLADAGGSDATDAKSSLCVYFAMLGFSQFTNQFGRAPTAADEARFPRPVAHDAFASAVRELLAHPSRGYHNVASFMGGVAAQETLKLVTQQYRPLDNLYIYDGVHSVSNKWKV